MSAEFMLVTFVLFLAGVIAVPISSRFGLGSVLGYLIAGITLGPLLGAIGADVEGMQHFAEFGVVMMLFLIGLEMNPKALWKLRRRIFLLGGLQVTATGILVAAAMSIAGQPWSVAIALGLVMSLSSTAIVSQTLKEKGLFQSDGGQAGFCTLLFQDIAVVPMLIFLPLLAMPELADSLAGAAAHGAGENGGGEIDLNMVGHLNGWQSALATLAAVGGVVAFGTYLTGPIFRFVSRARLRELFVTTALMMVLGISILMTMVGLSPALGTFVAGVVMAGSEYRHELESNIAPFRGIFLGVFFITVGAGIDFDLLLQNPASIVSATAGLVAIKFGTLIVLARTFGLADGDKFLYGLGLAQTGEFGFVLLSYLVTSAVLPADTADMASLVVALSMLTTPLMFVLYDRMVAPRYSRRQTMEADEIDQESPIIIAGHGRFGGIVNRALRGAGYKTTVLDYNAEQLKLLRRFGLPVYFGDATRPDLLTAAGIEQARVFVVAIDDPDAINGLVAHVVRNYPDVHIIARARDRNHVYDLWALGCRDIVRETYDGSLRMTRSTLEALGIGRKQAQRMTDIFEEMDRQATVDLAELHDLNLPIAENEAYQARVVEMMDEWQIQLMGRMRAAHGDDSRPE